MGTEKELKRVLVTAIDMPIQVVDSQGVKHVIQPRDSKEIDAGGDKPVAILEA